MQRSSISLVIATAGLLAALVVTSTASLSAFGSIQSAWQTRYPTSLSDDNTAVTGRTCYLCHAATNSQFNTYGWQIKLGIDAGLSPDAAMAAVEMNNSDDDPNGFTNLDEIQDGTQPGWTDGPNNTIWTDAGSTPGQLPPAGIAGNLDPVVAQEPDINVDPAALDFGAVLIGASAMRAADIQNTGAADLTVSGIVRCAGTNNEYTWSPDAFPITVPAGGSQTLSVFYAPSDVGTDSGCLEVSSNDPDESPAVLNLAGRGAEPTPEVPDINLVPPSLNFGTIFIGNTAQLTARIQNVGSAELTVSDIVRCPGASSEFAWLNTIPIMVPPGGSADLLVNYAPIDEGADMGCLELTSNDPDENPAQLALAGAGQPPATGGVDLDIARFRVSRTARLEETEPEKPDSVALGDEAKPVSITLVVRNGGSVDEPRMATVVGVQNGVEVYNQAMIVSDPVGDGRSTVAFPSYAPVAAGDIRWTATIADDDPDVDQASGVTRVKSSKQDHEVECEEEKGEEARLLSRGAGQPNCSSRTRSGVPEPSRRPGR
jgi:hypothetical protein